MKIRILCGQMEVIPGRPDLNYKKAIEIITQAKARHADMLLLPEMCLPGYLIGDLWEQQSYIDDCSYYKDKIIASSEGICIIFGSVASEAGRLNEDGHVRKYNAAFACQNGKPLTGYLGRNYVVKTSLPNYREFDDCRYFYSMAKLCSEENVSLTDAITPINVMVRGEKLSIGLMLCEDGWTENYHFNVPQCLARKGAALLCNLSSSPYTLGKNGKRNRLFSAQARSVGVPLIYCNNVGIQNNGKNIFTYDGCSSAYNPDGTLVASVPMYADTILELTWDTQSNTFTTDNTPESLPEEPESVHRALSYGTRKFLRQCNISKMTIGVSGGIDSAVTAAMYTEILGPENVLLLNLPSRFNSDITKDLAAKLASNLGANYGVFPITESFDLTVKQLEKTPIKNFTESTCFTLSPGELVKENIQARDRGARLIAAAAAAFGGAFSCNSNKAELSVGYATFYGDICGALAMLGDIWKYQVYALGAYLNENVFKRDVIPSEIFNIRPSAELSSAQTVGTGGDPLHYEYHDYLLRSFIENWRKASPADILRWYQNRELAARLGCTQAAILNACPTAELFVKDLERWWKLFAGFSVAKRIQAPPVLAITKRAYGYDHREAQLTPYFSREYFSLKDEILHTH